MSSTSKKVDFIGIGVNKAATTWIFHCLKQHPEICTSTPKEVNFFNRNYEKGVAWYLSHFAHCPSSQPTKGEYSPNYLHNESAPARIHEHFPETKLIVCLRNPIERILSAYYYNLARGKHRFKNVEERLAKDENVLDLEKGLYAKHLERYLEYFPREQILILIYEDIEKDPYAFMRQIYQFLGADDSYTPSRVGEKSNVTVQNLTYLRGVNQFIYGARRTLRKSAYYDPMMRFFTITGIKWLARTIVKLNRRKRNLAPMREKPVDPQLRAQWQEYYREDIAKLEKLIGRDLSFWQ